MAGLLHLVPRYLPRVGLAPEWVAYARPLVLVLFAINVVVTLIFRANVEAQGGAYATGVLVLMLSAAVAAAISLWKEQLAFAQHLLLGRSCWYLHTPRWPISSSARDGIIIARLLHPVYPDGERRQPVLARQGNPRGRAPLRRRRVGAAVEPVGGQER